MRFAAVALLVLAAVSHISALSDTRLTKHHLKKRASWPNPGTVKGDTTGIHDPSLVKTPGGEYILYGTGVGIPIWTSSDRTTWTSVGKAFSTAPTATDTFTGASDASLWAPDVTYVDNKYIMYYSASSFGSQHSAIFMAQSTTGLPGSWTNDGLVISTVSGSDYNAIDPHLIVTTSGSWYLSLGSFWTGVSLSLSYTSSKEGSRVRISGIKLIELSPSTGKPSGSTVTSISERYLAGHQSGFFY
ncbi:hypothetical protein P7C70_g5116, partial [Phenoliferia sp. Uapishka_3]